MEHNERGSNLIGYALVVALIGVTAVTGLAVIGTGTSSAFVTVSDEFATDTTEPPEPTDTALAEWEEAQAAYEAAIEAAKAERDAALAAAEAARDAGTQANEGLPKEFRNAADAQVEAAYTQAKADAARGYEQASGAARDAKNAAEAAYLAATG